MNKAIDNGILLFLSSIIVFQIQSQLQPVIALLLGIITSAIGIVYSGKRYVRIALVLIFCALCLDLPQLTFFLPLLVYNTCKRNVKNTYFYAVPLLFLMIHFYLYIDAPSTFNAYELNSTYFSSMGSLYQFIFLVLLCILSFILTFHTQRLEELEQDLIHIRDAGTELNIALREKNKHLLEKQDYEIYLATLKERNRIAREIHDNVGHMLSRSILQIGALGTIHKEEPLHEQLMQVNETLNQAMNSIRESVHDLHDDSIDLKHAITEVLTSLQDKYKILFDYDMTHNIPRNVKYCLISTVKEAVSNVIKHSNADKITLLLREHPGFYQLCMEDNGTDISKSMNSGIGLENMCERVEALNGTLRISTEKGFQIFITIPKQAE